MKNLIMIWKMRLFRRIISGTDIKFLDRGIDPMTQAIRLYELGSNVSGIDLLRYAIKKSR
jgi:hypothetical protein